MTEMSQPSRSIGSLPLIHELFAVQAAKRPDALAIVCGEEHLTYEELNDASDRIARRLQEYGVGPESLVAIHLDRGIQTVVAILGVLKAGGAYLPIDLSSPKRRIQFMLEDAKPVVILTEAGFQGNLPVSGRTVVLDDLLAKEATRGSKVRCRALPQNAAYVIYTSGSTGQPKGVVVTHANVVRLFESTDHWFHFGDDDVWTLFHSFAFDFSVWEMWGALLFGGKLVIVPFMLSRSPRAFRDLLVREKITVLNQTPSAFRLLSRADQAESTPAQFGLRWLIFGGEALELQSLKPWFDRYGDQSPEVANMYGITETTVHVTFRRLCATDVEASRGSVIGEPIPDLSLHILDSKGETCPIGTAGEIYVGGAGVARGYLHRPELNRERFLPDPFSGSPGDRLYRTGDLAQRLPNGDIQYLGRLDQQVKIRGFRIELGEIEAALSLHPSVREYLVTTAGPPGADRCLVAYLVCSANHPAIEELRSFLMERLPEHMLPAHFVFLENFPLNANGKVDRSALLQPIPARPELSAPFQLPSTAKEKALILIWESVLRVSGIGIHDNFFALGGDSIRSLQIIGRAQEKGLNISIEQLFSRPTVAELAQVEDSMPGNEIKRTERLSLLCPTDRARVPCELDDAYPMARLQTGMLFHNQRDPDSAVFHDVFGYRLHMPFDEDKLKLAVNRLIQRHSILRTSFDLGNFSQPLQLVYLRANVPLTVDDLRAHSPSEQEKALVDWIEHEKHRPFALNRPPLMRLHVQRQTDNSFQFIVSFHHVIMDGWSLAAMLTELFKEYRTALTGGTAHFSPPPISYRDYIHLELEAIDSEEAHSYWVAKLQDAPVPRLPRWSNELCRGGTEQVRGPEVKLSERVLVELKALAKELGVPLRTILLAAHCRVLSFVTGQSEIVTGLVSNGRPQVTGGDRLIGLFLNTLPFRVGLTKGTWQDLIQRIFQVECEILPYRRCPLAVIQQWTSGIALFETVFDFVQFHVYRDLPGYDEHNFLEDHYFEANNFAFYVTFMLNADGNELQFHFDYDPKEFCAAQIEALCDYYDRTITAIANAPHVPFESHCPLPDSERIRLMHEWNQTERAFPPICVHELIAQQAARTPSRIAARCRGDTITYEQLESNAARVAKGLRSLGVGPGKLVGLNLSRSIGMLASMLGVLKSGGAYVPLDPDYPRERLNFIMEDADLAVVIADGADNAASQSPARQIVSLDTLLAIPAATASNSSYLPAPRPDGLAYVIYTSGSTGQPKGVQVTHRALANFLASMREKPGLDCSDKVLALTTLSFDIAALELLLPLTLGAEVIIGEREVLHEPKRLANAIQESDVTVVQATPTTWRVLLESGWQGDRQIKALCGGETLSRPLADKLVKSFGEVWNMYGPTETTVWSCIHKLSEGTGPVPIGRPIANTEVYLLDEDLRLVPTGSVGEIFIGGAGLAQGYLHRPELTEQRFVTHPLRPGTKERLYRTGDLGRYLPDGNLLCLGRTDHQVKIRGVRIELGEIETTLAEHPSIASAVVAARVNDENTQLVAYYVPKPARRVTSGDLRTFLEKTLSSQMIPSVFVELASLPFTPNGKLDRRRLPSPPRTRPDGAVPFVPPQTPLECEIASVWKEILRVDRVGLKDSFFELGGHSLLAIQSMARLRNRLGIDLNLAKLFQKPHLGDFALEILSVLCQQTSAGDSPLSEAPTPGGSVSSDTIESQPIPSASLS